MLVFCPNCGTVLTVSLSNADEPRNRLECRCCPYSYTIHRPIIERRAYTGKKDVEDVFGGPEAWANAQKTTAQCTDSTCNGMEAAFFEVQIRSADEPMTQFLRCMTCGTQWRN